LKKSPFWPEEKGLNNRLATAWKAFFQKRWKRWLDQRLPRQRQIRLGHRSIFILPSAAGWVFSLLLLLMLMTAINYQNSLIYALVFWLFAMGGAAMYLTFRNLSGLMLSTHEAMPCFVGDTASIPLRLGCEGTYGRYALVLGYPGHPQVFADVSKDESCSRNLLFTCTRRGYLQPGRIRVETRFPAGLFRAWTHLDLDVGSLVYPRPETVPMLLGSGGEGGDLPGVTLDMAGQQDFRGLRSYQNGDSLRQIAWKQLARGKGLMTKEFDRDEGASCWLEWTHVSGDVETRLSRLCGWVLHCHELGWLYGLRLPGVEIRPEHSEAHLQRCLRTLAVYALPEDQSGVVV
jgi:uncharacterized protein (DUF58 family)